MTRLCLKRSWRCNMNGRNTEDYDSNSDWRIDETQEFPAMRGIMNPAAYPERPHVRLNPDLERLQRISVRRASGPAHRLPPPPPDIRTHRHPETMPTLDMFVWSTVFLLFLIVLGLLMFG